MRAKKMADSKLGTKKFLSSHKVAVPETIGILKRHQDNTIEFISALEPPFVIKPNNWYGGKGILVFDNKTVDGNFVTNSGEVFSSQQLQEHLSYILDGFFSLSGGRDKVLIEKKIILTKEIDLLGTFGLPDLRVVCYNMVPVMAMMRIPTEESDGKANIHGWACAAGVDIGTGKITYISHKGKTVKSIPGIGDIRGITLPSWDEVLSLVVKVQQVTGIKFLWCDVVLDETSGPLLLEMNIRPGLEIQNVNLAPLRERLDKIEWVEVSSVEKWVRLGKDLFSGDIEDRIKVLSWKQVVWSREYIKLFFEEREHQYLSQIRVSEVESKISREFASNVLKIPEEKNKLRIEWEILGIKKSLRFDIDETMQDNISLGKNSLRGFLIDPFKYKKWENPLLPEVASSKWANTVIKKTQEKQLLDIDKKLFKIDKHLLILKYINPINVQEEKQIFIEKKGDYTPRFIYPELTFSPDELEKELKKIEIPDIRYSEIFEKKKQEIYEKIQFFKAFLKQDTSAMYEKSRAIFWNIDEDNLQYAKHIIDWKVEVFLEDEYVTANDIAELVKKFNHIYWVKIKFLETQVWARFVMKWDSLLMRAWAKVWKKEMRSIIAHEIEWHYLRKINGRKSSFKIMSRGGARYIETDEGIAIYNQNRFLSENDKKYYGIFERYYFLAYAQKHSYKRLIERLIKFYDHDYERVFTYMLRLKRWFEDPSKAGVFMKDVVYVNGFMKIDRYLSSGWSLKTMYLWKLHMDDIEIVKNTSLFAPDKADIIIPFSA